MICSYSGAGEFTTSFEGVLACSDLFRFNSDMLAFPSESVSEYEWIPANCCSLLSSIMIN